MIPHAELLYIAQYGYIALFLIILGSELFSFLPVGVLLVGMGALSHAGYYNFFFLLIVSALAASVSDYAVFTIARRMGAHEGYRRYVAGNRFATSIEGYLARFPTLTIVVSRFVGISTTATNALAGLSQVSRPTFVLADFAGNALCCLMYLALGYSLGAAAAKGEQATAVVIGIIAALVIAGVILFHFFPRNRR